MSESLPTSPEEVRPGGAPPPDLAPDPGSARTRRSPKEPGPAADGQPTIVEEAAEGAEPGPDGVGPGASRRSRRRGSRGRRGRGRGSGGGAPAADGDDRSAPADAPSSAADATDPEEPDPAAAALPTAIAAARQGPDQVERLPDLPDLPGEGKASPAAADRATIRRPKIGDTRPAPPPVVPPAPAPRRRRRGGKGPGPVPTPARRGLDGGEESADRRRGRERKGRPVGRYLICVHVRGETTQIAVLEGRSLIEHYVTRPADDVNQIHGNIYVGRVQNVLPGMEAAFVEIGTPKNAVLYRGDVQYDREDVEDSGETRIEHLLRPGQMVMCQVTKNPIGSKGARLTQEVSLPGRFVVLLPNSTTYGISKRLDDDERRRLRKILDGVRPAGHGLIVRTAAEGASADELRLDVDRLLRQWQEIERRAARASRPTMLYREEPLVIRVIREEFNKDYRGVVVDDPAVYEEVREYVADLIPELADRVELYDDPALPLFERHHVHEQLHKALDRKVWLPSGGSVILERTEALTVIDVNTGRNVGTSSLEETVFRNNVEAAEEIARQLRLRDIGGIIVIDFIDMESRANRDQVMRAFKEALARDKTRTQVFDISELGLVEMTRKRVSEGLVESFSAACPTCNGRGIVIDESLL